MAQDGPESRTISLLARFDESLRQQAIVFATLNLFALAALLLLHSLFSSLLGEPSPVLLVTLGAAFLLKMLELLWLWAGLGRLAKPGRRGCLGFNFSERRVSRPLTFLTNRADSPYFVLLALPILQAAYASAFPLASV